MANVSAIANDANGLNGSISVLASRNVSSATLAYIEAACRDRAEGVLLSVFLEVVLGLIRCSIRRIAHAAAYYDASALEVARTRLMRLNDLVVLDAIVRLINCGSCERFNAARSRDGVLVPINRANICVCRRRRRINLFYDCRRLLTSDVLRGIV